MNIPFSIPWFTYAQPKCGEVAAVASDKERDSCNTLECELTVVLVAFQLLKILRRNGS
jgi:hypothetical protein